MEVARARVPEANVREDMEVAWERVLLNSPPLSDMTYDDFSDCWNTAVDLCVNQEKLNRRFRIVGQIGSGGFADVTVAFDRELRANVALKMSAPSHAAQAFAEVRIWRLCVHPNIIRVFDVLDTPTKVCTVTELAPGGELLSKIDEVERFDDSRAREIVRQLASALAYLHDEAGVAHRDIKPENLLCTSTEATEIGVLKLSDFGFAARIHTPAPGGVGTGEPAKSTAPQGFKSFKGLPKAKLTSIVGTPDYMAPEQLELQRAREARAALRGAARETSAEGRTHYDELVDCWALGCVAYELLSGAPPFVDPDDDVLNDLILAAEVDMTDDTIWPLVSGQAKDLIRRLLERDPAQRLAAREALDHPWLTARDAEQPADDLLLGLPEEAMRRQLVRQHSRNKNRQRIKEIRENRRFRVGGIVVSAVSRMLSDSEKRR
mmetsp:Transcript_5448/g.13466  ORF Transcript_5448/g.13466 Transcript_5448/m.13466 type:complete len:434 (-) Transcript_5448:228-1529(-)